MKNNNTLETISGIVVVVLLVVIICIFKVQYSENYSLDNQDTYNVYAYFNDVGDLSKGADIKISGVKIGEVKNIALNDHYIAQVTLNINKSIELPIDSEALIYTNGIIGPKYVNIIMGFNKKILNNEDKISRTKSAINIERIIGKVVSSLNKQSMTTN